MDYQLGIGIGDFTGIAYLAFYSLIIIAIAIPWLIIALVIIIMIGVFLSTYVLPSYKDASRVEAVTKSPLISFTSESLKGCSVIRAFDKND